MHEREINFKLSYTIHIKCTICCAINYTMSCLYNFYTMGAFTSCQLIEHRTGCRGRYTHYYTGITHITIVSALMDVNSSINVYGDAFILV